MVTVALSDIQSNSEHTQPGWKELDIPPTPVEESPVSKAAARDTIESFGPVALQNAAPAPVDEPTTPTLPKDNRVDEDADLEVDWENLEKTEEQEPRGEGSDDVSDQRRSLGLRECGLETDILSSSASQRHFSSLVSSKRTMPWPLTLSPGCQTRMSPDRRGTSGNLARSRFTISND